MKKSIRPLAAIVSALVLPVAQAGAQVDMQDLDEDEWWEKQGFGLFQGYYTQYKIKEKDQDFGKPMQGGGFGLGGEYVNDETHFGIGGAFNFSFVMQDYTHYKADDFLFGLDVYVPARISTSLTVYAGVSGTMHGFSFDCDEGYALNNGRKNNQLGSGEEWKNDGLATTWNAFIGVRWRFAGHAYVFGEYRREFGKIDLVCENYEWRDGSKLTSEQDMGGNRFLAGLGLLF